MKFQVLNSNIFWDKISALCYDYEVNGIESFIILDMNSGLELIMNISSVRIGSDSITGILDDGTEILVSVDTISSLRYNPNWTQEDFILEE